MSTAAERPLVIVSNRGPLSFAVDGAGDLVVRRGAGGLVTALGPAVSGTGATWVAAAITDADRRAVAEGGGVTEAEGFRLRSLVVDEDDYHAYYDAIANATLWFLHHGLHDTARRPRFDRAWHLAWRSFVTVNHAFADATAEEAPEHAVVLVQDYQLPLVGARLVEARPDLTVVHFTHTPFAGPDALTMLPAPAAEQLMAGMAAHHACGFHTERWADAYRASHVAVLGGEPPATFVAPAAADAGDIAAVAASPACADALAELEAEVGGRKVIVRVDRIELSKNLLRGFHAFDDLLRTYPQWREGVVFAAFVYPSREGLAEYLAYRQEVEALIARINATWATPGWTPILYDPHDDFPRSVASLRRFDVLLVNPVRDGLNLVAKEGVLVNERDGVLALSTESGAFAELGDHALAVNPFDVAGTADVVHRALSMSAEDRGAHAAALRQLAAARGPADWLADQLAAGGY